MRSLRVLFKGSRCSNAGKRCGQRYMAGAFAAVLGYTTGSTRASNNGSFASASRGRRQAIHKENQILTQPRPTVFGPRYCNDLLDSCTEFCKVLLLFNNTIHMAYGNPKTRGGVPVVAIGYLVRSYGVRPLSSFADVLLWIRNASLS